MILTLAVASSLAVRLDTIMTDPALRGGLVGVYVCKPDGTKLYEKNASTRMIPASNEKILSVFYALSTLGTDWRPETRFWKQGNDIVVDAIGDPLLSPEQLTAARKQLGAVPGTRIFARQAFAPGVGPTWEHDDLPHAYAARITALTVDAGRFTVRVSDRVPQVPVWSGVAVRRGTGSGAVALTFNPDSKVVLVKGALPKNSDNLERFALPDPARSAALLLGGALMSTTSVPERVPDLTITGQSVAALAKLCLEPSDNMLAEHLFLMAAGSTSALGSDPFSDAATRMTRFYESIGIAEGQMRPQDGSGMSRHDLITPQALAQVLQHIWSSDLKDLFLEALPKPGEGTLKGRLTGLDVYAKTGTLDSASCLSGFVMAPDGPVVFSIMMNHFVKPASQIRAIQDKIVQEICLGLQ